MGGGKGAFYKAKYGGGGKGGGKGSKEEASGGGGKGSLFDRAAGASGSNGAQENDGDVDMGRTWNASDAQPSTKESLVSKLIGLEGRQYPMYRGIENYAYRFSEGFTLILDRAQTDPYAPPSKMRFLVSSQTTGYSAGLVSNRVRRIALADYLCRRFWEEVHHIGLDEVKQSASYHAAKGGELNIERPTQHVLERTSVVVYPNMEVEVRFQLSLPARGRSILGEECARLVCGTLPSVISKTIPAGANDMARISSHLECVEDQESLRLSLPALNLVAFVANGAILPRRGGDDDRPMEGRRGEATRPVPFRSPESMQVTVKLPNRGEVTGMGIRPGVTLIVGGGFHGKSTLLRALEVGVYNHVPGDGREFVVSVPDAVKVRAEDKRGVQNVNISPFLNNLPMGKPTDNFSTQDASGSTSQASNIIEALEVGASALLIDEDTCATNFMIRDRRMQLLVSKDKEPITPFILKVRQLFNEFGTSTVCVVGGAGDYLEVADQVVMMDSYEPKDVTAEAKAIVQQLPSGMSTADRERESGQTFGKVTQRIPLADGVKECVSHQKAKVMPRGIDTLVFGSENIDFSFVEQVVEKGQLAAIGDYIQAMTRFMDGRATLKQILDRMEKMMDTDVGCAMDLIKPAWMVPGGTYSRPRRLEVAAAINRLRTMKFLIA